MIHSSFIRYLWTVYQVHTGYNQRHKGEPVGGLCFSGAYTLTVRVEQDDGSQEGGTMWDFSLRRSEIMPCSGSRKGALKRVDSLDREMSQMETAPGR